jgi:molybdopterin/thiamine biosynthesis adenylyltransferase
MARKKGMDAIAANKAMAPLARYLVPSDALGKNIQEKIQNTTVGIVGLGGVGGFSSILCAQAGFDIIAADGDVVEERNLARQVLYSSGDVGKNKAAVAKKKLASFAPASKIIAVAERVDEKNIGIIFANCDIVLDCTDNFATRKIIEGYCIAAGKLWIYASATDMEAMACIISAGKKFLPGKQQKKKPPRTLNSTCAIAAALQVRLLYAWIQGGRLKNTVYYFDLESMQLASRKLRK